MRKLAFLVALMAFSSAVLAKLDHFLSPADLVQAQSETNVAILDIRSEGFDVNEKTNFPRAISLGL